VKKFLHRLKVTKKEGDEIYVFGLPNMLDSGEIDLDLYDQLNIRLSYFNFVDVSQPEIVRFRQQFFDTYRELPSDDTFLGYDIVTWMSDAIKQEGTGFIGPRTKTYSYGLFNPIELIPEFGDRAVSDDFRNYDYLENRSLKMIKLVEYRFKTIKGEE